MHRSFFCRRRPTADTHFSPYGVAVADHEATGSLLPDFPIFEERIPFTLELVGLVLRFFLLRTHVDALALPHLRSGGAISHARAPVVRQDVALVEHVIHAAIDQSIASLELVEFDVITFRCFIAFHAPILPPFRDVGAGHEEKLLPASTTITRVTDTQFAKRGRGHYDLIVVAFVGLLLISNVAATKLIQFGPEVNVFGFPVLPLITDGGALLFPLTYVIGDVLAEVYGMKGARRAILMGFVMAAIASLMFLLVGIAPPAADWPNQEAFDAILGFVPRIVLASLSGYLLGQLLNAWVLVKIKARTSEKGLWARLLGSTLVGEAADTTAFCLIAFYGVITGGTMINYILVGYIWKVLIEVLVMPITYQVIKLVKRYEPSYVTAS